MARRAKPWWRKESKCFYVMIRGVQQRLDPDKRIAYEMFHTLMGTSQTKLKSDHAVVLIDKFLEWCEANRPDSYAWYFQFLNPFCKEIADVRVDQVKAHHVERFIDKPTWGASAKRGAITAIKRAFNWSVKQGYISQSPVRSVEKPEAKIRETVISLAMHKANLKAVPKAFGELLELAWETGARPLELYGMETRHLELKESRAVFPRSESKGKKKQRVVYFSKKALAIVKRNMRAEGAVLRNSDGNPWNAYAINCAFGRLAKKTSKDRLCLYAYRHSFGHRKLTEGTDSLVVATLMGHSDLSMLHRVYGHIHQNKSFLLAQLNK